MLLELLANLISILLIIATMYLSLRVFKILWKIHPNFVNYKWTRIPDYIKSAERVGWSCGGTLAFIVFSIFFGLKTINEFLPIKYFKSKSSSYTKLDYSKNDTIGKLEAANNNSPGSEELNKSETIPITELAKLSTKEIENRILIIYARRGNVFVDSSTQKWANEQPWYDKSLGRTMQAAENHFSDADKNNLTLLRKRWSELQFNNVLKKEGKVTNNEYFEPSGDNENKLTSLNLEKISTWNADQIRIEINSVYARYGVDFSNTQLKDWANNLPYYNPVIGRTFAEAETLFSDTDKHYIEILAKRRDQIKESNPINK